MKKPELRRAYLALALLFGWLLSMRPAGVKAQEAEWQWQHPIPTGTTLLGVWGTSGSDLFVVGKIHSFKVLIDYFRDFRMIHESSKAAVILLLENSGLGN